MINPKAYTEVNEIIKSMPDKMQSKIPANLRKTIEYNMDNDYIFKIEDFDEINLLEDTEKILSVLYTDYFATEEERKIILAREKMLENEKELEKQKKYPPDFLTSKPIEKKENIEIQEKSLVVKKEKLYVRVFNKIKELLGFK